MSHRREPASALERVSLTDLQIYLDRAGWKRGQSTSERWVVYRIPNAEQLELVLPKTELLVDARERIGQAIATIGQLEERAIADVCSDLISINADSLLIRLQVQAEESLPLGEASRQVRAIRNLVLYSGCSELQAKPYFDQPLEVAVKLADQFRFCHTYHGSFGFEVASTVVPPKATTDLFDTPIRRRVVERIVRGVKLLDYAVGQQNPDILIESYERAFNSRMCDALIDISLDGDVPFSIGVDWASSVAPSDDVLDFPDHLVGEEQVSVLKYVSERLKIVEPKFERINGQVVNLHCVADPMRGDAKRTIAVKVNHPQHGIIEVKLSLGPEAYLLAIEVHSKGKPISASGQLQRKGNAWTLDSVSNVSADEG